ncbi:MAG TPA: hypothetical protein VGI34_01335, partial [Candidatus Acidoferrales bacterium]
MNCISILHEQQNPATTLAWEAGAFFENGPLYNSKWLNRFLNILTYISLRFTGDLAAPTNHCAPKLAAVISRAQKPKSDNIGASMGRWRSPI